MKRKIILLLALALGLLTKGSLASTRDQARRLYKSIAGVAPTRTQLDMTTNYINNGQIKRAGRYATQNNSFYMVTVKNFATPWTNEDRTVHGDLNDLIATVIGFTRDERPFDQILWKNVV